jgi:Prolyl oligopeptidase family
MFVAWGAIFDFGVAFEARVGGTNDPSVPGYVEHAQWVFGTKNLDKTRAITRQMTLENVADKITCPLLIVHGENDWQIPLWHAEKTYAHAVNSKDRELRIFHLADGGDEHCGADNGGLIVDYITDWVAEKLGALPQGYRRSVISNGSSGRYAGPGMTEESAGCALTISSCASETAMLSTPFRTGPAHIIKLGPIRTENRPEHRTPHRADIPGPMPRLVQVRHGALS